MAARVGAGVITAIVVAALLVLLGMDAHQYLPRVPVPQAPVVHRHHLHHLHHRFCTPWFCQLVAV